MNIDYLYSKDKYLRHLKNLNKIKNKKNVSPVLVRTDVTNACNHRCVYCMYQKSLPEFGLCDSFNFKDQIRKEELFNFIKALKKIRVKAIMFAGGGEPTLHPNFKEVVHYALKNNFEVGIITNGAGLDESWLKTFKNKNLKWVRISLDAGNEKTWKKIHRPSGGNSFNKIIKLVKFFKNRKIKTRIGGSFVINDFNWKEILKFTELCKKNNFDDVRISFTYQIKKEKLYSKYKNRILLSLNQAKKISDKDFFVNILKERLESLESRDKNYEKCYFAFFSASVGADFKLYPCCMTKYAKRFCIADLRRESLNKKFLKKWNKKIHNIDVKKCPTCWYDKFNEACNYYSEKEVEFENFIN